MWEIEYTDEFGAWYEALEEGAQEEVASVVDLLAERGTDLEAHYSSGVNGSRHSHMRELKVQYRGDPHRVFYAFDPVRVAILLIGGDKTGQKRFYKRMIRQADDLYDEHIETLRSEGLLE